MASYQMRQRDPLLDSSMQAAFQRRGKEALGVGLIVASVVAALILWSYVPEDPGWLSATNEPVRNLMGRFGASLASPLYIIAGYGSWGVPLVLLAWGVRFVLHRGADAALNRVIFAPIAVAVLSVYASTHVPPESWGHTFGLGGLFGDTVLGAILGVVPVTATFGLKVVSVLLGAGVLAILLFVTGFDRREMRASAAFLWAGMLFGIRAVRHRQGRAAPGSATPRHAGAQMRRDTGPVLAAAPRAGTRIARALGEDPVVSAGVPHQSAGLTGTGRRIADPVAPQPPTELVEMELSDTAQELAAPDDDRIRTRISDVISARLRLGSGSAGARVEPGAGARHPRGLLAAEPPVTRAAGETAPRPLRPAPLIADTRRPVPLPPAQTLAAQTLPAMPFEHVLADDDDADDAGEFAARIEGSGPSMRVPFAAEARTVVLQSLRKGTAPSRQAVAEAQPRLRFDETATPAYEHPPLSLLSNPAAITRHHQSVDSLEENARMLESVLDDYGVKGEITSVRPGPVVTMYELEPAPGLKASRVIGLADDIARSMSALSARVSTVPGRTVIGIELPNAVREKVVLREILSARDFGDSNMRLPLALGKDIGGDPIIANLAKMPHLLIAGTTGSGKSVAINTMILSLLYKLSPEECRLIMIDPKMLELSVYDGIPHLLSPVVTDPKKAVVALKWVVGEMEERYRKMSKMGVRNIEGYNGRVREALSKNEMFKRTIQTGFDEQTGEPVFETDEFMPVTIPYIVVVVDEMADLMMVAGKEIEACIQRLAQMARASGIHLIMATQRPSVDVITGTIKANFPTRISFQVTSKIDSRTILGEQGAEQLLGMGDMLYMAGGAKINRIHGPFVSDEEVEEIVTHLKSYGPPVYMSGVLESVDEDREADIDQVLGLGGDGPDDALYDQAVAVVIKDRKCSTSYIQRKLAIGYNKAARLVEQMETSGVVTAANHVGKREILVPEQ